MRKSVIALAGVAVALTAVGCDNPLEVNNTTNPDVERAYATPAGVEQVIGTLYQQVFTADHGSIAALHPQMLNMAFESYASVANNGMSLRAAIPRLEIQNGRGNQTAIENLRDYSRLQRAARTAANTIGALDTLVAHGLTTGSPGRDRRARAFAFFANGVALGNVAMAYDSAAIANSSLPFPSPEIAELSGHTDVMAAALASLDSAEAIILSITPASAATLDAAWVNGNAMTADQFARFIRSYRARFRAGVARTPAERAAVDWNKVIADATNGIQADVNIQLSPSTGWSNSWISQHHVFLGWHQMPLFIIGMADTTGAYASWLATPLASRAPFLIRTPDKRFPSGDTRAAQQASSPPTPPLASSNVLYFRNRATGEDTPGEAWGTSFYDHYRFKAIADPGGAPVGGNNGPWPMMTKAEIDMLAAEGYIRTGQFALAVPLIDAWRTRAGLPALGAIADLTTPVPGGNACVPRVPVAPSYTTTACGNIMEAMKWEKRMESAITGWGQWYFDSRGWGDLAVGTTLEYPVPYQEMDARAKPFYNLGGVGGPSSAAAGTYGF